MARIDCQRCGDRAGTSPPTATNSPWYATNPAGEKVPVCGFCWSQLRSHLSGMPKVAWDDEPIHKQMDRLGIK